MDKITIDIPLKYKKYIKDYEFNDREKELMKTGSFYVCKYKDITEFSGITEYASVNIANSVGKLAYLDRSNCCIDVWVYDTKEFYVKFNNDSLVAIPRMLDTIDINNRRLITFDIREVRPEDCEPY